LFVVAPPDDRAVRQRQPLGDDLDSGGARHVVLAEDMADEFGGRRPIALGGGATSGTGTDLVVVLDRRSVGILWETGRLIERGLDRGEFVFGHDAVSGHGARHIRANLLNSKHLESRSRVTSRMTSL
jgi:hypothetical protein